MKDFFLATDSADSGKSNSTSTSFNLMSLNTGYSTILTTGLKSNSSDAKYHFKLSMSKSLGTELKIINLLNFINFFL